MGINKYIHNYEKNVLSHFGLSYNGLFLCELGNQRWWAAKRSAKTVYKSLGVNHTSIDINGKNGALKINLDNPVPLEVHDKFDLVTDYGTIEHVNNQYQVFKNVHDMCRISGLMIHAVPKEGNWYPHGRYYYSHDFIKELSELCGYGIYNLIDMDFYGGRYPNKLLVTVTFIKGDKDFPSKDEFNKLPIFDSGDLRKTGNYT